MVLSGNEFGLHTFGTLAEANKQLLYKCDNLKVQTGSVFNEESPGMSRMM